MTMGCMDDQAGFAPSMMPSAIPATVDRTARPGIPPGLGAAKLLRGPSTAPDSSSNAVPAQLPTTNGTYFQRWASSDVAQLHDLGRSSAPGTSWRATLLRCTATSIEPATAARPTATDVNGASGLPPNRPSSSTGGNSGATCRAGSCTRNEEGQPTIGHPQADRCLGRLGQREERTQRCRRFWYRGVCARRAVETEPPRPSGAGNGSHACHVRAASTMMRQPHHGGLRQTDRWLHSGKWFKHSLLT